MTRNKIILILLGVITSLGFNVALYITYLSRFFGFKGISINEFNEAGIEFVLIPVALIVCFWAMYELLKLLPLRLKHEPKI